MSTDVVLLGSPSAGLVTPLFRVSLTDGTFVGVSMVRLLPRLHACVPPAEKQVASWRGACASALPKDGLCRALEDGRPGPGHEMHTRLMAASRGIRSSSQGPPPFPAASGCSGWPSQPRGAQPLASPARESTLHPRVQSREVRRPEALLPALLSRSGIVNRRPGDSLLWLHTAGFVYQGPYSWIRGLSLPALFV